MTRWILIATAPAWVSFHAAAQDATAEEFNKLCAACHGAGGSGTDRGPALVNNRTLRSRSENEIRNVIRNGTSRGMPPFALPERELESLTRFIRSLEAPDHAATTPGDALAGERFFFGKGQCGSCHMVRGRGTASGPDLSNIARQLNELVDSVLITACGQRPQIHQIMISHAGYLPFGSAATSSSTATREPAGPRKAHQQT